MFYDRAAVDFIVNGQGGGQLGERLRGVGYDTNLMRPFFDEQGRNCVLVNTAKPWDKPVYEKRLVRDFMLNGMTINGPTTLRKDEWIQMDRAVLRITRDRLRAWTDLAASSTYGGFNGMGKMLLEHETMSDAGEAFVDFDGITEGRNDQPLFQLEGLPLPITHSDFWMTLRRRAVSENGGTPLDTTMAEMAGRRVAEKVEQTTIGIVTGLTYGNTGDYGRTPTVYGYLNFPDRVTMTALPTPTGSNGQAIINYILSMIDALDNINYHGPYMLYTSNDWDKWLDQDYVLVAGSTTAQTLRQRIRAIERIRDVRRLDFLKSAVNPYTMLLVQMTPEVARAVNGMDVTVIQWTTMGGLKLNFKVMCIYVPQLRADYNGNTGILQATAA